MLSKRNRMKLLNFKIMSSLSVENECFTAKHAADDSIQRLSRCEISTHRGIDVNKMMETSSTDKVMWSINHSTWCAYRPGYSFVAYEP